MARFYTNENIGLPVVVELRRLGHDVLTSLDAGKANRAITDVEVLSFAAVQKRILLSRNRHYFLRLHERWTIEHAGIVLCTFDPDFIGQASRIHITVAGLDEVADQLIRVNRIS